MIIKKKSKSIIMRLTLNLKIFSMKKKILIKKTIIIKYIIKKQKKTFINMTIEIFILKLFLNWVNYL
jgi:hypothetical protein